MRCRIGWHDAGGEDKKATLSWLKSVGMHLEADRSKTGSPPRERIFEIELAQMPEMLAMFSRLHETITISRITHDGITFYLTNVLLENRTAATGNREPMIEAERADGSLFVPMSNVICINGFGSIRRVDMRVKTT
jgi:hypothetical protein